MPFPPEFLRELNDRNRIEDIAASYVNLRRRGKNLVGLCPFHNEKTRSFCVYTENNSLFCFGCNKGGGSPAWTISRPGGWTGRPSAILAWATPRRAAMP